MSFKLSSAKSQRTILLFVVPLILTGCASLGKKECLAGNWTGIGNTDGTKGELADARLAAHTKACGKHGVQPDTDSYMAGHAEGLKKFCTTESGYNNGTDFVIKDYSRDTYNNVCPADLKLGFLTGYIKGLKLNLDILHEELVSEKAELEADRDAFLLLKVLNSSKADGMEENIEEADEAITEKQATIDSTIKEIDKWLLVEPELEKLLQ